MVKIFKSTAFSIVCSIVYVFLHGSSCLAVLPWWASVDGVLEENGAGIVEKAQQVDSTVSSWLKFTGDGAPEGKKAYTVQQARQVDLTVTAEDIKGLKEAYPDTPDTNGLDFMSFEDFQKRGFSSADRMALCQTVMGFFQSQPYCIVEAQEAPWFSFGRCNGDSIRKALKWDRYGGAIGRNTYPFCEEKAIGLLTQAVNADCSYREFIEYAGYLRCMTAAVDMAMFAHKTHASFNKEELWKIIGFNIGLMGQHFQQTGEEKFTESDYSFRDGMSDFLNISTCGEAYYVCDGYSWQGLFEEFVKGLAKSAPVADQWCVVRIDGGEARAENGKVIPLEGRYVLFDQTGFNYREYSVPMAHNGDVSCFTPREHYKHWELYANGFFNLFLRAGSDAARQSAQILLSRYFLMSYPFNSGTAGIDKWLSQALWMSKAGGGRKLTYHDKFRPDILAMVVPPDCFDPIFFGRTSFDPPLSFDPLLRVHADA